MYDMGGVVEAADLDDPMTVAAVAGQMTAAVDAAITALQRVDEITDHDVQIARESIWLLTGAEDVAELASESLPIIEPDNLLGLITGPLLSQIEEPGAFHATVLEHRRGESVTPDTR